MANIPGLVCIKVLLQEIYLLTASDLIIMTTDEKKQSAFYDSFKGEKSYVNSVWQNIEPFVQGRVLDIGGNDGSLLDNCPVGEKYVVDFAQRALIEAKEKGCEAVLSDMHHLPFKGGVFNTLLMINTFEHSPHPFNLLKEAKRTLGKKGRVIIDVPNSRSIRQFYNLLIRGDPLPSGNSPFFMDVPNHYFQYSSKILKKLLVPEFDNVKIFGKGPVRRPFKLIFKCLPKKLGSAIATDIIGVGEK
jgi:ubiquinone/menaquinone biosynthesis C-methylase UbiE